MHVRANRAWCTITEYNKPRHSITTLRKTKVTASSKRPRNKRNLTESKPHVKPSYSPPVTDNNSIELINDSVAADDRAQKRRKRAVDISTKNKYKSPAQAPEHIKESDSNQRVITELRRSPRVPIVKLKYLKGIKAQLRDPDEDE